MNRRRLARALTVLAVPALLVPIAASPATAAPKAPRVPTLAQVVKIYPGLRGAEVEINREPSVKSPGTGCDEGKRVKGAVGREAEYSPAFDLTKPGYGMTGATPSVSVVAERFPTTRAARGYFTAGAEQLEHCFTEGDDDIEIRSAKPIRFRLGAQHAGYRATAAVAGMRMNMNVLAVRAGRHVVFVMTMSLTKAAPSIAKTVDVARLALRTAR